MLEIVRQLEEEEQINGIGEEEEPAGGGGGGGGGGGEDSAFESLAAAIDSVSYTDREGYLINDEDVITIRRAHAWKSSCGLLITTTCWTWVRKGQLVIPEDVMPGDLAKPPAGLAGLTQSRWTTCAANAKSLRLRSTRSGVALIPRLIAAPLTSVVSVNSAKHAKTCSLKSLCRRVIGCRPSGIWPLRTFANADHDNRHNQGT